MSSKRPGNEALRVAIQEAGVSYDQLAADIRIVAAETGDSVRTNRSAVCHWATAGRRPVPRTAAHVAEALSRRLGRTVTPADLGLAEANGDQEWLGLGLGSDPLDTLRRLGHADVHRRSIVTSAAYSVAAAALPLGADQAIEYRQRATRQRVGHAEVVAVRDMTAMYTAIDERHGGQHGRSAVVQYLTSDVARLCRVTFAREKDRTDMLSAAASVAYLCGWKAYDAGEHGLAQRYYLQAYQLTREAEDDLHGAWILRILAHNGMDVRRSEHTLDLAEAALGRVRGRIGPSTLALFQITRARALANAGCGRDAVVQMREAQDTVLRGDGTDLPHWAALWGSARACVSSHTAKTLRSLADHAGAERHYAAAVRGRPGAGFSRITALSLAAQGREQAAQGHLEQACHTWKRSLELFDGVRSARAAEAVGEMRREVRRLRGRAVRAAQDLDERARAWQRSHG